MKKVILPLLTVTALTVGLNEAKAQTPYKSAIGIVFDGSDGANAGIQYKTALTGTSAAQFQAAFGSNWISLGADWLYQRAIPEAQGLSWYAGAGAQVGFHTGSYAGDKVWLGLRPQAGLEFKLPTLPLAVHLDYKPYIGFNKGTGFNGDGFTFGVKYIIK